MRLLRPRRLPAFRGAPRAALTLVALAVVALLAVACGGGDDAPTATPSPTATPRVEASPTVLAARTSTPEVRTPSPTPQPTPVPTVEPTPEPTPEPPPPPPPFEPEDAYVVSYATSYSGPSADSKPVRTLAQGTKVHLVDKVFGENWIIGDQDWVPIEQYWERSWFQLEDGSWIYRAFVWFPEGPSPFDAGPDRYVIVDVSLQMMYAMDGSRVVREIPVTSGKDGFETPTGNFAVQARVLNERMTSERAGIEGEAERYDVQRVLFTQYFADGGFALHLNYWQPYGVYGSYPTSHGCVGIPLAEAQFLWLFSPPGMRVIVRDGGGATPAPAPVATAVPTPEPTQPPTATPAPTATPKPPTATATAKP